MTWTGFFLLVLPAIVVGYAIIHVLVKKGRQRRQAAQNRPAQQQTPPVASGAAAAPGNPPATASTVAGKSWSTWFQEKIDKGFSGGTIWTIAAFLFLEYALYKYVPFAAPMFVGWGLMHILIYIIAIIILAGLENAKGKQKVFGVIAMVVALTVIGLSHTTLSWPSTWFTGYSTNPCDSVIRRATVGQTGSELNPGGRCSFTFQVTAGKLYFSGPEGPTDAWWPDKPAIGEVRKRITSAHAVTASAELEYMLCPAGKDGSGWYCH